jgi:hypothetical protein
MNSGQNTGREFKKPPAVADSNPLGVTWRCWGSPKLALAFKGLEKDFIIKQSVWLSWSIKSGDPTQVKTEANQDEIRNNWLGIRDNSCTSS